MNILEKLASDVKQNPEKVAINTEAFSFTYGQVDSITNEIANIISEKFAPETVISLSLKHSYLIILSVIGILKAGCTYVPLAGDNSHEKNEYIKELTNCNYMITDVKNEAAESDQLVLSDIFIGQLMANKNGLNEQRPLPEICYILFTSGSTGKPKGVLVTSRNLDYILQNMQHICPGDQSSTYCFTTPYTFDVAATEMFGWIEANGSVIIFDLNEFSQYRHLVNQIGRYHVTHFGASPSLLNTIFDISSENEIQVLSRSVKFFMVAGEEMPVQLVNKWQSLQIKSRLFNCYGPTEATVYATYYEVKPDFSGERVPIGKPLDGAGFYIDQPNEAGVGELVITGDGVTNGYLNNPQRTKQNFGQTTAGEKYYRTGDLASCDTAGNVIFHGRNDDQIELNGIRVELGEIDYYLNKLSMIDSCKTLWHNGVLITFYTGQQQQIDVNKARSELGKFMPKYMMPNTFIHVDHFPLNRSNKVDTRMLLTMLEHDKHQDVLSADQQDDEDRWLKIFADALGHQIGYDDDFFEHGGDSLRVVECVIQLENICHTRLEMDLFYEFRTPRNIINHIQARSKSKTESVTSPQSNVKRSNGTSLFSLSGHCEVVPASYTQRLYYYKKKFNMVSFTAKVSNNFLDAEIAHAIEQVAKYNPVLRTTLNCAGNQLTMHIFESLTTEKVGVGPVINGAEVEKIQDELQTAVFQARYAGKALLNYVITTSEQNPEKVILFCVDHCIFDASCISIFKDDLLRILNKQKPEKTGIEYADYCAQLLEHNSLDQVMAHPYTKKIARANQACQKLFELTPVGPCHVVVKNVEMFDGTKLSYLISYLSSAQLSKQFDLSQVSANLILNLRHYAGFSVERTIGDMHSTVQLVYEADESYSDYWQKSDENIAKLFTGSLYNPRTVTYNHYPDLSPRQEELRRIIGNDVPISISFVGLVEPSELTTYEATIQATQASLVQTADLSRIYATAVLSRNDLHIFYDHQVFPEDKVFDFVDIK
ncbi:non-ribosomal peptide synthetase [Lactiplantibacillus paraplantarum]|uniref:non-ribosomal peptide synthetase n=1 Tax=Lactiplantibacillus paraplantarum TaxID=60520 RepID=UPI0023AA5B21|nr:non-ribosomal peptide synthetase [Lactiplantibacillus paraplantarum]WEE35739.1 non-ribosomal peptide synthetase [Lactiplantibacillus paraplantarum]